MSNTVVTIKNAWKKDYEWVFAAHTDRLPVAISIGENKYTARTESLSVSTIDVQRPMVDIKFLAVGDKQDYTKIAAAPLWKDCAKGVAGIGDNGDKIYFESAMPVDAESKKTPDEFLENMLAVLGEHIRSANIDFGMEPVKAMRAAVDAMNKAREFLEQEI